MTQQTIPASGSLPSEAYKWHRRPKGESGKKCSICLLPREHTGTHRAIHRSEGRKGTYQIRDFGGRNRTLTKPAQELQTKYSPKGRKIHRPPTGPTKRTVERLTRAASMVAMGKTFAEVAIALGETAVRLRDWQSRHRPLWDLAYDRTMETVRDVIRAQAGTSAALNDPQKFVELANVCKRWSIARGEPLFTQSDRQSLSAFFENYYQPQCLGAASAGSVALYRHVLFLWRLFAADPPLSEITSVLLASFRDWLLKMSGRRNTIRRSPNTVRAEMRRMQTLLDKAGPPGPRNRDAADLICRVPYARPPRALVREPRIARAQHIEAAYLAAVCMELPRFDRFRPAAWWRALIVTAYNTGLRRRSLFSLRSVHLCLADRALKLPAEIAKTGREQFIPLNATTLRHLQAIRPETRERVFDWPHNTTWFDEMFHRLQSQAGIPVKDHFGLHDLRRTAATNLWEFSPAAAQLLLGHTTSRMTRERYVKGTDILARAVEELPQPVAFGQLDVTDRMTSTQGTTINDN